ncbi:hypothetical protein [Longibacter salinarum]|nr:hypothetical protein [Longibacter salinarum]
MTGYKAKSRACSPHPSGAGRTGRPPFEQGSAQRKSVLRPFLGLTLWLSFRGKSRLLPGPVTSRLAPWKEAMRTTRDDQAVKPVTGL